MAHMGERACTFCPRGVKSKLLRSLSGDDGVICHIKHRGRSIEWGRFPHNVVDVKIALKPAPFKSSQIPHAFHPSSHTTGIFFFSLLSPKNSRKHGEPRKRRRRRVFEEAQVSVPPWVPNERGNNEEASGQVAGIGALEARHGLSRWALSGPRWAKFKSPAVAEDAYSSPIQCPSLHFLGEMDFLKPYGLELLEHCADASVIHHPKGHTVPRLNEKGLDTMMNFIDKIQNILAEKDQQ